MAIAFLRLFFEPSNISGEWQEALFFLPEQNQTMRLWRVCQQCLMTGARELKTGDWMPWSKWLDKIQRLHIFCVTKENWDCHHTSLKQFCLPTEILFPKFRGRQATGDGFACTALGQVQPALFPLSFPHLGQTGREHFPTCCFSAPVSSFMQKEEFPEKS